jgi:hypothetical protein
MAHSEEHANVDKHNENDRDSVFLFCRTNFYFIIFKSYILNLYLRIFDTQLKLNVPN